MLDAYDEWHLIFAMLLPKTLWILYFLEYTPGLKLNPVSNWTLVNLPIQIEKFKSF